MRLEAVLRGLLISALAMLLAAAIIPDTVSAAEAGTWSPTGNMSTGRARPVAVLLPQGNVLVIGGWNDTHGPLSSTELYDPATGVWSETGSMSIARLDFTATLLRNGKVLVAGGRGVSEWHPWTSAELYDPATGTWSLTGSMSTNRALHTATLLPSGKVMVAGGWNMSHVTSAEVYDPATGVWSETGSMSTGRELHAATLLAHGGVLVTGGSGAAGAVNSAELYNPAIGRWSPAGSMNLRRCGHTATLLRDGTVLVVGGSNDIESGPALPSAERYDPASSRWSITGSMNAPRYDHTATLLQDGRVLIAGGKDDTYGPYYLASELYDWRTDAWSVAGTMNATRTFHTAVLLPNGEVLAAGGWTTLEQVQLASAERFAPPAVTNGAAAGFGQIANPLSGVSADFSLNASLLENGHFQGSLRYAERRPDGKLTVRSTEIVSLSIVGSTAVLLGTASLQGVDGYSFLAVVTDHGEPGANTDTFALRVTDPTGVPVPDLSFDDTPASLQAGNVQVRQQPVNK